MEYGILACQISLDHRSFYMHNITLQRRELRLRYVNQIERQTPIMRVDVFKHMAELFSIPNNVYGIEFEICAYASKYPNAIAIDEVSMLHTRAYGVSPMYQRAGGREEVWRHTLDYLAARGLKDVPLRLLLLGAVDAHGRQVEDLARVQRRLLWPRAVKSWRELRRIEHVDVPARWL